MPIIELQIKTSAFLTMQRNVLRNLAICPPDLPPVYGIQIVMDKIEFGNSALRHNTPAHYTTLYSEDGKLVPTKYQPKGFQTQLAQDVTVYLTTMGDILAHPNDTPTLVPLTATLVYDLDFLPFENEGDAFDHSFDGLEHDCILVAQVRAIELGVLPILPAVFDPLDTLPPAILNQIKSFMMQQLRLFAPGGSAPVGLNALPKQMRFINAGISVDTQLQFIAVRVQVGGGSNENADRPWTNFYSGFIEDRLQGNDFAFYVESTLLTEKIKYEVDSNLPTDDNLDAYPNCVYSHSNGKAVLTINVFIIYHLYRNYYLDLDVTVSANPTVNIELTIAQPNLLTVDFDYSGLLNTDDPLVDFVFNFVDTLGIPLQQILLTIAGNYILPALQENISDNCQKISNTHIQCTKQIKTPLAPGSLQTALNKLVTFDNGIAFAGTLNVQDLTPASISTAIREFKISTPRVSCGAASMALIAAFSSNPQGFGVLAAKGFIGTTGTTPVRLCLPLVVLRGGSGPFPLQNMIPSDSRAPFDISINIAAPDATYYNAPYPLDLLVKTSAGTRLLRFAPPPVITAQDYRRLTAELLAKIGNCNQLVDDWARLHRGYNPRWSPRPPEGLVIEHMWEVIVTGLAAGDKVALLDVQNRELASAVSSGAPMRLMTVVTPSAERELTIVHVGRQIGTGVNESMQIKTADNQDEEGQKGLEVRQRPVMHRGSVPLRGPCKKLVTTTFSGKQCVAAVLEDRVLLYDFSSQHMPVALKSWTVYGVRGVVAWLGGLLAYGDEGLQWCSNDKNRGGAPGRSVCMPIVEVVADHRTLYAITQDELRIYSAQLCLTASVPSRKVESIILLGNKLIMGGKEGLSITDRYDLDYCQSYMDDHHITSLRTAFADEPGLFAAELDDGSARSFCFRDNTPEMIAHYSEAPWHSNAVRSGDLLVKIGAGKKELDLFTIGAMELA